MKENKEIEQEFIEKMKKRVQENAKQRKEKGIVIEKTWMIDDSELDYIKVDVREQQNIFNKKSDN